MLIDDDGITNFCSCVMATAASDNSRDAESALAILSALIEDHGKGNPPRLKLDRLSNLFAEKADEPFRRLGLGKFKKFVISHFHYDEASTEVRCKATRKKKQLETSHQPVASESGVSSSPNGSTANELGKLQLSSPSSLLREKRTATSSSSVVDSTAATASKGNT